MYEYDGVRWVSGLRRDLAVSVEYPYTLRVLCRLRTILINKLPAKNLQREGRSLFFIGICGYVWGLLRKLRGPETRRTQSYVRTYKDLYYSRQIYGEENVQNKSNF